MLKVIFLWPIYVLYRIGKNYEKSRLRKQYLSKCDLDDETVIYEEAIISNCSEPNHIILKKSYIRGQISIIDSNGYVSIGRDSYVGKNVNIYSGDGKITIGDRVLIGPNTCIYNSNTHPKDAKRRHAQFIDIISDRVPDGYELCGEDVVIDDDVWIASNCTIMKGVHINKGGIVGAGSVVTRDVPAYAVVHGNPAQICSYTK